MATAYKRILLKLSGEVLAGEKGTGIDNDTVVKICTAVKKVADLGVAAPANIWIVPVRTISVCWQRQ